MIEIWGRYLEDCIGREPQRERELRQDFARKRWNHFFLEGCSLLHDGHSREARLQFGRAIGEAPFSPRAYAFLLASYLPARAAGGQSHGGGA